MRPFAADSTHFQMASDHSRQRACSYPEEREVWARAGIVTMVYPSKWPDGSTYRSLMRPGVGEDHEVCRVLRPAVASRRSLVLYLES